MTWQAALDYVINLNQTGLCGFTDWRLPNAIEFLSLTNYGVTDAGAWLEARGFSNVAGSQFWTSNTELEDALYAHYYVADGFFSFGLKSDTNAVWPVRGGQ